MATIERTGAARSVESSKEGGETRFLIHDVPWDVYVALCEANDDLRMTYLDGMLEFMSPGQKHERFSVWFGIFILQVACGVGFPIKSYASTTWRKKGPGKKKGKGKEADDCFYIASFAAVHRKQIDLKVDPPPDLAIEVEISEPAIPALMVYSKLKVPEVWRFDGETLRIHVRTARGTYQKRKRSSALPYLLIDEVECWMSRAAALDDDAQFSEEVRAWARETLLPRLQAQ